MENTLLGSGVIREEKVETKRVQMPDLNYPAPAWRYHKELCPHGKIVRTDEELVVLDAEGWVKMPRFDEPEVVVSAPEVAAPNVFISGLVLDKPVETKLADKPDTMKDELAKDDYTCQVCGKRLATLQAVTAHARMAHKKE